jgi:hypothetical protein
MESLQEKPPSRNAAILTQRHHVRYHSTLLIIRNTDKICAETKNYLHRGIIEPPNNPNPDADEIRSIKKQALAELHAWSLGISSDEIEWEKLKPGKVLQPCIISR